MRPGGGAGSVSYAASYGPRSNAGTFGISPKPGDRLAVSVYYDRQGHDYFTVSDLAQAVTQTARVNADLAGTAYTTAVIGGEISNSAVTHKPRACSHRVRPAVGLVSSGHTSGSLRSCYQRY